MDINTLQGLIPDSVISQITDVMTQFQIDSPLRLSHFLAQCACESGDFKIVSENLNYSADSLLRVFPTHFTADIAASYAHNPEAIASRVYANRMGNSDEASKDGYIHRGFGFIELTGKTNQTTFFTAIGLDPNTDPSLIGTQYPLLSAAWFWNKNNLNSIADTGATTDVVTTITKHVNGGINGLPIRISYFNQFWNVLNS
jgi:putative chitinase